MQALRLHLRPLTWVAFVAILALALLPSLSHAWAWAQGSSPYVEVCTPQGARLVALNDDGSVKTSAEPAAGGAATHLQHCPLCSLSIDTPVLPPAEPALVLAVMSAEPPLLFLQAPHTLHAWRSAQPRGPPATS